MADIKAIAEKRTSLLHIDPRKLEVKPGLNARDFSDQENIDHVEALARSILANGFYPSHPLAIFREVEKTPEGEKIEHIYIGDGECRWRGAMRAIELGAELLTITAVQLPKSMNDVDLVLHRNLANTGKKFTSLEEGKNIKHALALGATPKDVAQRLGKSESYISQLLAFQAAPIEVHNMVQAGEVSVTLAMETVREEGKDEAKEILRGAIEAAKKRGKSKATAKDVRPLKSKTAKAKERGERVIERTPDHMVVVYSGVQGEYKVTFGDKPVLMTRKQWQEAIEKIADKVGWPIGREVAGDPRPEFLEAQAVG